MATLQCGQYGCRNQMEREGDIYCPKCGGRKRAVEENLVPATRVKFCNDRRGVVKPGRGFAGTGTGPRPKKSREEREKNRKNLRAERNSLQPTGRREGAKGQSGCEGRGDSKKSKNTRAKREKKRRRR